MAEESPVANESELGGMQPEAPSLWAQRFPNSLQVFPPQLEGWLGQVGGAGAS